MKLHKIIKMTHQSLLLHVDKILRLAVAKQGLHLLAC